MVVDDDEAVRASLGSCLRSMGCEVIEAADGHQGLERLRSIPGIDAILSDVMMPGMNGVEFVRRVKELDRSIVAVVITAYPSVGVTVEAMRAGASDFLTKPFRLDQLRLAVQRAALERRVLLEQKSLRAEVEMHKALEHVNRQLELTLKEQAVLFTISETLGKVQHLEELYREVTNLACAATGSDRARLWTLDEAGTHLDMVAARGDFRPELVRVDLASSMAPCASVARFGHPVALQDTGPGRSPSLSEWDDRLIVPLRCRQKVAGVLSVAAPTHPEPFPEGALATLQFLAERASLAYENLVLYQNLHLNHHATLEALIRSLEARDPYTKSHSQRVTRMAVRLAELMGSSSQRCNAILYAGHLHDIGKIGIRDSILTKPGKLTPEEYRVIQRHPVIGEQIVARLDLEPEGLALIRHHHERWDGTGYPDRLGGREIPAAARILSVADAYDAVTSDRPYHRALESEDALAEIRANAGTQFDPRVVEALGDLLAAGPAAGGPDA
nr:HD domain-containing phosphohydrolase [Dissulfurirhabdus thermomarina]